MPFNINKCQIQQIGSRNIEMYYEMCGIKIIIKSIHSVKDLGVTVASNLSFPRSATSPLKKANWMMGLIKIIFSFKNKDVILPLYNSFVRPHLEYATQFSSLHHAKDIAKLVVQRRAIKMIPS